MSKEIRLLIDRYISEQNALGSRYRMLAYLLAFSDCYTPAMPHPSTATASRSVPSGSSFSISPFICSRMIFPSSHMAIFNLTTCNSFPIRIAFPRAVFLLFISAEFLYSLVSLCLFPYPVMKYTSPAITHNGTYLYSDKEKPKPPPL